MSRRPCARRNAGTGAARTLGSLSGGERQRVLLARALAVQAPVLLMDEPLANLDPPHQADWLRIVRRHVQRGGTAVSVLHEITMALHADDMVVMDAGRVVHQGACAHAGHPPGAGAGVRRTHRACIRWPVSGWRCPTNSARA